MNIIYWWFLYLDSSNVLLVLLVCLYRNVRYLLTSCSRTAACWHFYIMCVVAMKIPYVLPPKEMPRNRIVAHKKISILRLLTTRTVMGHNKILRDQYIFRTGGFSQQLECDWVLGRAVTAHCVRVSYFPFIFCFCRRCPLLCVDWPKSMSSKVGRTVKK